MYRSSVTLLLIPLMSAMAADLDFSDIGVYAADFEFCTMSVLKVRYFGESARPEYLRRVRERLKRNVAEGRTNVLGLYTFDRVKYSLPLQDYIGFTDTVLDAIDMADVHALFLSEENVVWNNGLAILNGLYDHIKKRFPEVAVYQWLTSPDGPHPALKADGWLYDHYGHGRASFRRKLTEFIITGKPLILCLNASPDVARRDTPKGGALSREQWEVCREFNIPVFYYCVDLRWGNPYIWWHSNAPELASWRNWLLGIVDETERTDIATLPRRSADYTDADTVEAAPDENGRFVLVEDFGRADLLGRFSTRGFTNLRWSGSAAQLAVVRQSKSFRRTDLFVHIVSDFEMSAPRAVLDLAPGTRVGAVRLMLSATGHNWPCAASNANGQPTITADASETEKFAGKTYWVRIAVDAGDAAGDSPHAILENLRFECSVTPPEQPGITLEPDRRGRVSYADAFASAKYRWLAAVDNGEAVSWRPGELSITGVAGRANRVTIRWPVTCERALSGLTVRLRARANGKNLGSTTTLGVSIDGDKPLLSVSTRDFKAASNGWQKGELALDLSADTRFNGVTRFWVHAEMVNGSGVKTNRSNMIESLSIDGQTKP